MLTGCDERVRFTYTPNYCEENIYLLLRRLVSEQIPGDFYTVFVSNRFSSVALFSQIKGDASRNHIIVWDYHVFLVRKDVRSTVVYDFVSLLDFPTSFLDYRANALCDNAMLPERLRRMYRVVSGESYLQYFASDRQHMIDSNGKWLDPPPSYSPIRGACAASSHTLPAYLKMDEDTFSSVTSPYGVVLSEPDFFDFFS